MNKVVQILPLAGHSNTASIANAISRLGYEVLQVQADGKISSHLPLIIPGVGTFSHAMNYLRETGLDSEVISHGGREAPLLGICLGFQILFEKGFEGSPSGKEGLGLLPGVVTPIESNGKRKANIGWRELSIRTNSESNPIFYFCHSFQVISDLASTVSTRFDNAEILSMATFGAIRGYQFHPELSGTDGLELLADDLAFFPPT